MEDIVVAIEIKFAQMSTHTCALQLKTKTAKRWTVNLANEQNGIVLPPTIKVVRFFVFSCKEISNLHFETSLARHFSQKWFLSPKGLLQFALFRGHLSYFALLTALNNSSSLTPANLLATTSHRLPDFGG